MPFSDVNLWTQLFEQIPMPIRILLGIVTAGMFTLLSYIWKRHQKRLELLEERERNYATKSDIASVNVSIDTLHGDVKKIMFHLMDD